MSVKSLFFYALAGTVGMTANAVTLTTASYDNYSYTFAGTNNENAETINISQYNSDGHFTFGVMEFDVSSITYPDTIYLNLRAAGYTDGGIGSSVTADGSYGMVNVVLLPEDFSGYLSASDPVQWFEDNVRFQSNIAIMDFQDQEIASFNLTGAVDGWKGGAFENHGIALWSDSVGSVQIESVESDGVAPQLGTTNVPEPQTYALLGGLAALGVAFFRRRR